MVVVTKLPTVVTDLDAWTSPDSVKADGDSACASKTTAVAGTYTLNCSGYGFAIPADATITLIRIFIDGNISRVLSIDDRYMGFRLTKTGGTYAIGSTNYQLTSTCAKSTKNYYSLPAGALTVAQLNAESFTTKIYAVLADTQSTTFYCDCAGIEVTYTPAVDVIVTAEDLSVHFGFEWDEITYTATVLDEDSNKLPASFVVNLRLDGVPVVSNQALNSSVYSQSTGLLTLVWYVPSGFGEGTVDLQWAEQTI